jgi:hypothetical protein
MKVTNWYRNGDLDAFHEFCTENKRKLIAVKLRSKDSEIVKGILYDIILDHMRRRASSFF